MVTFADNWEGALIWRGERGSGMFSHKDVGVILVPREYVDVLLLGGSC